MTQQTQGLRITVLAGGVGPEREVSLSSGQSVWEALNRLGHQGTLCDITPDDLSALDEPADFVFIALHGEFGEDGTLQAELDRRGVPYCGSGAEASRRAMNKVAAKECFRAANIPTPRAEIVNKETIDGVVERLGVPVVIKPIASGSSVDTVIPRSAPEIDAELRRLIERHDALLVEEFIDGPEFTVGIVGTQAVPVCQIIPAQGFYDYEAKYLRDDTRYEFEIDLPAELLAHMQTLSVDAFAALGCAVFGRVDWMVDRASHELYALEINTIPGFTSHSLLPKAAARVGISFDQLCQRIVELSLARFCKGA
jgi:D-alanine-D-alanine ligase